MLAFPVSTFDYYFYANLALVLYLHRFDIACWNSTIHFTTWYTLFRFHLQRLLDNDLYKLHKYDLFSGKESHRRTT